MKRDVGFSVRVFVACALVFAGTLSFSGCQNDLLESPSFQNRGSYSTGRVAAPTNVTATQGGFRSITLKWTAAKSAVLYNIYSSDTATGNFEFLEQTPDATCSYTLSESPDVKKYYKIKSVDSNGEVSELYSQICFGTTLATPIITSIKQNANGDEITVRWYKGVNCTTDTYLNSGLIYTVVLYNADGTQVIKEETISAMDVKEAADTKYTFKNLTPNTEYCIQIKAYTKAAQDSKSTENSDILNQSTAHSLIPAAPENFAVSKGTSKDQVTLSWTLPKFAEIKSSTAFETRPVYFKIYRKLESAPENAYEPIVSYLGTVENKEQPASNSVIYFEKTKSEGSEEPIITVSPEGAINVDYSKADETNAEEAFPSYIPGAIITYIDKNVKSGQKYSYRVQSFIDDNKKKNVTSDESLCEDSGWLINTPTVSVSSTPNYNKDNTELIDSFTITLNFKFDDFGQKYNYVITETCQEMENVETGEGETKTVEKRPVGNETTEKYSSTSYVDFFPWKHIYETKELKENHFKYYSYSVAIKSEDGKTEYASIDAPGKIIVIEKKESVPDVDDFAVQDGFSNKFLLSWTYDETCSYKVIYTNKDKNGKEESKIEKIFAADELKKENGESYITGDKVTFAHQAESGDIRTVYTLVGSNGFESSKILDGEYKTLGTPDPYFEPSYKSIKVIWKPVQKAVSYKIKATYNNNEIQEENISKIETDENGNFYCVITEPYGETIIGEERAFNTTNAEIAGKPIDFEIEATSSADESTTVSDTKTTSEIKIATLGPASTDVTIEGAGNLIAVKWKKVEGAKGYLIFRKKYSKEYVGMDNKADVYFYSDEDNSLSLIQDDSNPSASCNETAGLFTFYDKYKEAQNYDSQYETDQAQIAWGIPFGYTVIPVLKDSDFSIDDELIIRGTDNSISYTSDSLNNIEEKGATYGYGLALTASKATTEDKVNITWKTPYKPSSIPVIFYRPYNYDKNDGKGWNMCNIGTANSDTETNCTPQINYKAYDYLVCYEPETYTDLKIEPYLEKYLSEQRDNNGEKLNKGYIFSFAPITAEFNGQNSASPDDKHYYSEKVFWSSYDYEERAVGPLSCSIEMMNTNKTLGWKKLADIEIGKDNVNNGFIKSVENLEDTNTTDLHIDTSLSRMLIVAPKSMMDDSSKTSTNGLMKVLRDAKHYYRIRCQYLNAKGETADSIGQSVYAYRNITDEELTKSAMLAISYAFYLNDGGAIDYTNINENEKNEDGKKFKYGGDGETGHTIVGIMGNVLFSNSESAKELGVGKCKHSYIFTDFVPKMLTPSNETKTFLQINSNMHYCGIKSAAKVMLIPAVDPFIYKFIDSADFNISLYDNSEKNVDYNAILTINSATKDSVKIEITRNGEKRTLIDTSDNSIRKQWLPMQFDDSKYELHNKDYGWWED